MGYAPFLLSLPLVGLLALAATASASADTNSPDPAPCAGEVEAVASGDVEGRIEHSISINLDAGRGPFTGAGTYDCGVEESGLLTLSLYEDGNIIESYRSVSGTLIVSEISRDHMSAEFDVSMEVWGEGVPRVQLKGSVRK